MNKLPNTLIKIKVVPDSNIYIAAALNKGYCHDWLFGASKPEANYELFVSEAILSEVSRKLENRFKFTRSETTRYLTDLDQVLTKIRPSTQVNIVRDSSDNMILECALEAKAELVITFDKDLLVLKQYNNIQIAHPRMLQYWFT
ncbi:MAG TPA: putative toxin-antitoxin system toxin component, PIN family [Candidatus Dormibacteraeota bacterium]|nr:putative toxin-antitoxin system toxin component, PIN family [Candidatus Dormibacteraeota bacterium]